MDNTNVSIYRYKLDNDIINLIYVFSNIHKYDDRQTYKEAWLLWINDNKYVIEKEKERLIDIGYKGDVIKKMYIAGRYYFRTKNSNKTEPKIKTNNKTNKIIMSKDFISIIDRQINRIIQEYNYKPSEGYIDLCNNYTEIINKEIDRINNGNVSNNLKILNLKIKKTYKNRYFIISRNFINNKI